jgi:2'-5' RNA ligase
MDYCIGLYFDSESTMRFTEISNAIANITGNRYLTDSKFKPHITLACFQTDNIAPVKEAVFAFTKTIRPENIIWPSLGVFPPSTLFAAPLFTEYLRKLNVEVNELIYDISIPGEKNFYLPNRWVPHTALAVQLTNQELMLALETAVSMFTRVVGKPERLFLGYINSFDNVEEYLINRKFFACGKTVQ